MLVCDKIYNMNPENPSHSSSESDQPQPLEAIMPETIEEMVDRQQRATDPYKVWGPADTLVAALENLRIAEEENKGDPTSDAILKSAELRVEAARREVLESQTNPTPRP